MTARGNALILLPPTTQSLCCLNLLCPALPLDSAQTGHCPATPKIQHMNVYWRGQSDVRFELKPGKLRQSMPLALGPRRMPARLRRAIPVVLRKQKWMARVWKKDKRHEGQRKDRRKLEKNETPNTTRENSQHGTSTLGK